MSDLRVKLILDMIDRVAAPTRQLAQRFDASMRQMSESTKRVGRDMRDLGKTSSAFLTAPLALLTRQSISVQKEYDAVRSKMIGVFRDTTMAEEQMKRLRQESDRLGTVFLGTTDSYASFTASVLGGGFALEKSNEMFNDFMETAVALDASPEKMGYIFTALEQMAGKPAVAMEELKVQLSDHIPGAIGIAARAMGMPVDKFIKAVESGRIKTSEFLPKFAKQVREELGGSFEEAAQGVQAFENREKNIMADAEMQANRRGLVDFYKALWRLVGDLAREFLNLSPGMQKFVVYLGIGAMLFGPLLLGLGQMLIAIGFLMPLIGALPGLLMAASSGSVAFGVALLTTPIGWFVLGLAAITVAGILLTKNWAKVSAFFSNMWEGIKSTFNSAVSWIMNLLQPLLTAIDRVTNSKIGQRLFGSNSYVATAANASTPGAPEVPFGGMGGLQSVDAGGIIKIEIDASGQPQVKEAKTNDKRMAFSTDTGLLMGAR